MKLSRVNTGLLVAIILINGYIILAPFLPMLASVSGTPDSPELSQRLQPSSTEKIPDDNRLIVPAISLDAPINEGRDLRAAHNGSWRRPATSTPERGGNTVIVGHRFTYSDPRGSFYFLNKLKIGDQIGVFWEGKRYVYKVAKIRIVPPNAVEIEKNTANPQLTLYTCTPLWWPKDRLVVTALPEEKT